MKENATFKHFCISKPQCFFSSLFGCLGAKVSWTPGQKLRDLSRVDCTSYGQSGASPASLKERGCRNKNWGSEEFFGRFC